jgi:hypothetical protein
MRSPRQNEEKNAELMAVNEKNARALGATFWNIAREYGFNREEQAFLLGIKHNRARLGALEKGKKIPVEYDAFFRVATLLGIHKNLRIIFPHNRELVYQWMKTAQPLLGNQVPMEYISKDPVQSMPRLFSVRRLLDQIRCR